jgi:actin-like ATPase involved in cell morphogenesis
MDRQLQTLVRQRLVLRIEPAMAAYIARHIQQAAGNGDAAPSIPIIAADARTGVPVRMELSATSLRTLLDSLER